MEAWSVHNLYQQAKRNLGTEATDSLWKYAQNLIHSNIPVIFSLRHLSKITDVDYSFLRSTVERKRESANYKMFAVKKRTGGRRFIHAVSGQLLEVQQFLNSELLQRIIPHPSSFAFHPNGGIRKCATLHCRARWLFQFDLQNFFHAINETDVFNVFHDIGYRSLVAFEFARICTTTRLPKHLNEMLFQKVKHVKCYNFYKDRTGAIGVLPQGAPTSPMLSNLVARKMDNLLAEYADRHGFVYTRYADDITISAYELPQGISIGNINRNVIGIIRRCQFKVNKKKTHVAGPGSKKLVLGLLVDGDRPRISRDTYKRIDRHLYASLKYGLLETSTHEGFESPYGFYNHISGLIAYVKDVDYDRWLKFKKQLEKIKVPWER